jgi:hypothetical protein
MTRSAKCYSKANVTGDINLFPCYCIYKEECKEYGNESTIKD